MILSPHFTLDELARTSHRSYLSINRERAEDYEEPLRALCLTLLEPVRAHFGAPVMIHSGFRCPELNAAIGGSRTSQHMAGQAADFHVHGVDLSEVWRWIWQASGLPYGQCILEGHAQGRPTWIHLSLGEPWRPRSRSRQHFVIADAP